MQSFNLIGLLLQGRQYVTSCWNMRFPKRLSEVSWILAREKPETFFEVVRQSPSQLLGG